MCPRRVALVSSEVFKVENSSLIPRARNWLRIKTRSSGSSGVLTKELINTMMEHFKLSSSNCNFSYCFHGVTYLQHVHDVLVLHLLLDLVGEVVKGLQHERMSFFGFQGHEHSQKLEDGVLHLRGRRIALQTLVNAFASVQTSQYNFVDQVLVKHSLQRSTVGSERYNELETLNLDLLAHLMFLA